MMMPYLRVIVAALSLAAARRSRHEREQAIARRQKQIVWVAHLFQRCGTR